MILERRLSKIKINLALELAPEAFSLIKKMSLFLCNGLTHLFQAVGCVLILFIIKT